MVITGVPAGDGSQAKAHCKQKGQILKSKLPYLLDYVTLLCGPPEPPHGGASPSRVGMLQYKLLYHILCGHGAAETSSTVSFLAHDIISPHCRRTFSFICESNCAKWYKTAKNTQDPRAWEIRICWFQNW